MNKCALRALTKVVEAQTRGSLPFEVSVHQFHGHPSGDGHDFNIRSVLLDGTVNVSAIIDSCWHIEVYRRGLSVVDGAFVLDVDGDTIAYVAWDDQEHYSGVRYPTARVRYAALLAGPHLGERRLGLDPNRGSEFLTNVEIAS